MSKLITIEAVNSKPKFPKFSNGSVLAGGKWLSVAKNVDISLFRKDTQMNVETHTNEKGYTSIVDVVEDMVENVKPVAKKTEKKEKVSTSERTYDEAKSRKILVQGITQSVAASPSLAGLPFTTTADIVKNIQEVALELIEFVDEHSK